MTKTKIYLKEVRCHVYEFCGEDSELSEILGLEHSNPEGLADYCTEFNMTSRDVEIDAFDLPVKDDK